METGNIVVKRTNQEALGTLTIQVYIDDKIVDEIAQDETKRIALSEGMHLIYAKVGLLKSKPVTFSISAGEYKRFELGSPVPAFGKNYLPIAFILFLVVSILGKYFQSDLVFWVGLGLLFCSFIVYFYFTVGRKDHLYLKEV